MNPSREWAPSLCAFPALGSNARPYLVRCHQTGIARLQVHAHLAVIGSKRPRGETAGPVILVEDGGKLEKRARLQPLEGREIAHINRVAPGRLLRRGRAIVLDELRFERQA